MSAPGSTAAQGGTRRILVGYSNASTYTTTTMEYLESFARYSSSLVHYLHVTHYADPFIDLSRYDAVILSYCARLCFPNYVSGRFLKLMDGYQGVRAIAIQDEYDFVEAERCGLDRLHPHVVFTCIPHDQREAVYPAARYPMTEFVNVLTGYVPMEVPATARTLPLRERSIHVGYRGRDIGPRYGMLGRMKFGIAQVFRDASNERWVPHDIQTDDASRIYGQAWYEWLGNCRCVLGTESGSNVFDFDGEIARSCANANRKGVPPSILSRIDELDRTFSMGQISARIFEATAMRSALVLYAGRYSDAIEPNEHYIPVAHDHSNLAEVFGAMADTDALEAMVERTHAHLIRSNRFSYSAFVAQVDEALARKMRIPPCGGYAPADPITTNLFRGAHDERPTAAPRAFDSFQLRQLRAQLERPLAAARVVTREMHLEPVLRQVARLVPRSVRRRLRALWT